MKSLRFASNKKAPAASEGWLNVPSYPLHWPDTNGAPCTGTEIEDTPP